MSWIDTSPTIPTWNFNGNVYPSRQLNKTIIQGFLDVSGGNIILRNGGLYTQSDISSNGNLYIAKSYISDSLAIGKTTAGFPLDISGTINATGLNINVNTTTTPTASAGTLTIYNSNTSGASPGQNTTASIVFPSSVNYPSDYGYILFVPNSVSYNSGEYNFFGSSNPEVASLVIGCENDQTTGAGPDSVIIRPSGHIVLTPQKGGSSGITYITGSVGIATNSPSYPLDVSGNGRFRGGYCFFNTTVNPSYIADDTNNLYFHSAPGGFAFQTTDYTTIMSLTNTGRLTISNRSITLGDASNNVGVGINSLSSNTGVYNTAFGWESLKINSTGVRNTAFGMHSLLSNTTANYNTAIGSEALAQSTTGDYNTALGSIALFNNTTGTNNVALGYNALFSNISGGQNTAVGYQALYYNKVFNTIGVGHQALFNNITGSGNTAIGFSALYTNTTGSNNTAIGYEALYKNNTTVNNIAIGFQALYNNTENYNTAIGTQALFTNTNGYQNTAIGFRSLYYNTTGTNNTALGFQSLLNNTTGYNNTSVGFQSLQNNTTGTENVAMGLNSLYTNTTGASNTALGYQALYSNTVSNNTAVGYQALFSNGSAVQNCAVGYQALFSNTANACTSVGYAALYTSTTGLGNTALGFTAGSADPAFTTGFYCTFLGVNTNASSNWNYSTALGHDARITASNQIMMGTAYETVYIPGYLTLTNMYTLLSDDRLKTNEEFITNATTTLIKLRPQKYHKYISYTNTTSNSYFDLSGDYVVESGLIAQEVYYEAPELRHLVKIPPDANPVPFIPDSPDPTVDPDYSSWGSTPASLNYTELIPYLIQSIKELNARIAVLESR
jgi:hypothetical protein